MRIEFDNARDYIESLVGDDGVVEVTGDGYLGKVLQVSYRIPNEPATYVERYKLIKRSDGFYDLYIRKNNRWLKA